MNNAHHTFIDYAGSRMTFGTAAGERVVTVSPLGRPASANLLLIHGLGDYPARHLRTARWLAGRGYRTVLLELAAHGGNSDEWARTMPLYETYAKTDCPGEVLHALRFGGILSARDRRALIARQYSQLERTVVDEHMTQINRVLRHMDRLTGPTGHLPLFLIGHSMGGLLAHETMWRMSPADRSAIAGVVMIAPALRPQGNPDSTLMQLAVNGVWGLRRAPLSPTRAAVKTLLDLNVEVDTTWGNKWLSDVPDELELSATEPLMPHSLPTRYASSIESLMVESASRGERAPYDGLVMVPRRDGITSREAAASFARRATQAGPGRVALVNLDVVAHDILRSSARVKALSVMHEWLEGRRIARMPQPVELQAAS